MSLPFQYDQSILKLMLKLDFSILNYW
jgi:hypothetical protein